MFQINPDNRVLSILSQYFDLVILSFLWLAASLPVVTIGVSTTSMYGVLLKLHAGQDETSVIRAFFSRWRSEWKRGTLVWLLLSAFLALMAADLYICVAYRPEGLVGGLLWTGTALMVLLGLSLSVYALPVNARFECAVKQVFTNSLRLAAGNPGWTLALIALWALIALSMAALGFVSIVVLGPLLWLTAKILYRVFKPIVSKSGMSSADREVGPTS